MLFLLATVPLFCYHKIPEKDSRIETLSAEAAEKDSRIETLSAEAAEKDSRIEALSAEAAEKDAQIEALTADVEMCKRENPAPFTGILLKPLRTENIADLLLKINSAKK